MSTYRVELGPAAVRALRKLDPQVRGRIQGAIALLAQEPRPPAARALQGRPGLRVRVGDHRIIYTVQGDVVRGLLLRAADERISVSEAIRRAIGQYLQAG